MRKELSEFFAKYNTLDKAFVMMTATSLLATSVKRTPLFADMPPEEQVDSIDWIKLVSYLFPLIVKVFPNDYFKYVSDFQTQQFKINTIKEALYICKYMQFLKFNENPEEFKLISRRMSLLATPSQMTETMLSDEQINWETDMFPKEVLKNNFIKR